MKRPPNYRRVSMETLSAGAFAKAPGTFGPAENVAILKAGTKLHLSFGYTSAQEGRAVGMAINTTVTEAEKGDLKVDVVAYPDIVGAKINLDGSPQGKTAWLTKPYFKVPPGQKDDYLASTRPAAGHHFLSTRK